MKHKNLKPLSQIIAIIILVALMAGLVPGVIHPVYAAPSDKAITAFNFTSPSAIGTINEAVHTITINVPFGTDVTALAPSITHNGVSVSPSSGVAQNFTNPVTYTVTAADSTMQNYTVSVVIPITVTAIAGQNKMFGGVDPVFTYTSSNFVPFTGALDRVAGETVGTYAIGRGSLSAIGNNYVVNFVSNNFTITARPVTVTANAGQSKVYGSSDPVLTYTSSDLSAPLTGALSRVAGEAVGNYPIGQGTLSAGSNYSINFVSNNFAITPKPITVTANPGQSKVFGSSDPAFTYISSDLSATFTGALDRVAGESVGTYAIGLGTLSAGSNYNISFFSNNFSITAKPITVTANPGQSKVFGSSDPIFTYTSSDLSASFTGSLDRVAGESVGTYAIGLGTLSAGSNYSISFVSNNFVVTAKPIIITPTAGQSKIFGASDPAFAYTSSDLSATFTGALSRAAGESFGTYSFTLGTLSAGSNYSLSITAEVFTITAKPITVTANAGQSKVFGSSDPAFAYTSSDLSATFTGALDRVAGETVGTYAIGLGTLNAGSNYTISFVSNNFAITAKPITVTANAGQSKVFGSPDPAFAYTSSDLSATFTGALDRVAGEAVGPYAIGLGTLSAGSNYTISFVSNNFAITAKPITITPTAGQNKVFGSSDPVFTYVSSDLSATFTGALSRVAGESFGVYNFTLGTLSAGSNYSLSIAAETFAITAKPITITPTAGQSKIFGASDPTFTYTSSDLSAIFTGSLSRVAGESIGTYNFTLGTLSAGSNYSLSITAQTFAIIASPAKDITAFSFTTPAATGVISGTNIAVSVPFGTNVTALVATFTTTGTSVSVGATTQVSGTTPNNFTSPVTYTVTAADASTKTYTVTVTFSSSTAKDITAFSFTTPAATGVITGTNIAITIPFGTNVTALVATFTTTGTSVSVGATTQVSGTTTNNFTSPVSYTITAADASTKTYTVTVTVTIAPNPAKDITAFSFTTPAVTGVITGANIAVTVPFGTNVTALVATFTTTGASVSVGATTQVSGTTANNFTSPVTYTVTAADASKKTYTVTVTVALNPAKDITAFSFTTPAATGVITGTNIAVTVPFGTNVTALVATFTTTGTSVSVGATTQVSGTTANNFTSPVSYTVTAADASTKTYTVTVTFSSSTTKNINTFSFTSPAAIGVISGTNIAVTVPFGTNVTALVVSFTTTGTSVDVGGTPQVSGITPNNFTSSVIYTVTAADASTKDYTVTVTVALNPAKDITAFSFTTPAVAGVITGTNIALTVPYGTDVSALVATFTTTGSSVNVAGTPQVSGTTANNFTSPVTYTVTAADASTKTYTVTVTVALNPAKDITAFSFIAQTAAGVINGTNISVTVPFGTDPSALVATFTTTGASVSVGATVQVSGTTVNNFTSPVTYIVTAADGTTKAYTVKVTFSANPTKDITAFSFTTPSATGVISGTNIAVTVPFGTNISALVATFTTTGSSVKVGGITQVSGTTANNFTSPVSYTVTAADASTKTYTVTVTAGINPTNKEITAFSFTTPAAIGVISGTKIAVTVPFGTNVSALVATFTTTGSSVRVGATPQVSGTTANNFTSPVIYTVTAADASTKDYTVTVTIAAKSSKDIISFSFTTPPAIGVISGTNITVKVPFGTNLTTLAATFTTTGSYITVGSTTQTSGTTINDFTKPVTYIVTAADGSTKTYIVTVTIVANDITAFGFKDPAVSGVISGNNIAVTVPQGTRVTGLIAVFTTTGASVRIGPAKQVSGKTVNNFTSPVTYIVVANDGSTKAYIVTVTISPKIIFEKIRSTGFDDGWTLESSEYSNLGGFNLTDSSTIRIGDDADDRQYRSILHFPTYYLPDNAVVTKVVLMIEKKEIFGTDPFTTHGSISVDIKKGKFLNITPFPPQTFEAPADMYSAGMIQNNPSSSWYWSALDSKALSYINLIGLTTLRLGFQLDDNDNLNADYISFYSGDKISQNDRPHLLIEYYVH